MGQFLGGICALLEGRVVVPLLLESLEAPTNSGTTAYLRGVVPLLLGASKASNNSGATVPPSSRAQIPPKYCPTVAGGLGGPQQLWDDCLP